MANTPKPFRKRAKRAAARGERLLIMDEAWTVAESGWAGGVSTFR